MPKSSLAFFAAHEARELLVDDLDHLLAGGEAFEHLAADGARGDDFDKVLDHEEVDVRFQQREFNLAHGFVYVRLGELSAPVQPLEYGL